VPANAEDVWFRDLRAILLKAFGLAALDHFLVLDTGGKMLGNSWGVLATIILSAWTI
jgi:hypothetical protein